MATLTVQDITSAGLEPSYVSAAAQGDVFANDGKTLVHLKNGSEGAITVTIAAQNACSLGVLHDVTIALAAGKEAMAGPFVRTIYNNGSGMVALTYSGVTSLTVGALSL